jgi:hypothetical protein
MNKTLQELIDKFDFQGVHYHLKEKNTKWNVGKKRKKRTPSVDHLKATVASLAQKLEETDAKIVASLGFTVLKFKWDTSVEYKLIYSLANTSVYEFKD